MGCFFHPTITRFDPMVTFFGITFILAIHLAVFTDFYSILRMKAGRDSEMNQMKIEILKISLIDEIIDL
jgi:Co/Zn/Cd efflux system component